MMEEKGDLRQKAGCPPLKNAKKNSRKTALEKHRGAKILSKRQKGRQKYWAAKSAPKSISLKKGRMQKPGKMQEKPSHASKIFLIVALKRRDVKTALSIKTRQKFCKNLHS